VTFGALEAAHLEEIADALRHGRLAAPYAPWKVRFNRSLDAAQAAASALEAANAAGVGPAGLLLTLDVLAAEKRRAATAARQRVQVVWSGPEGDGASRRDTAVVLRELFMQAEREVIISSYAYFGGQALFEPLYERLRERPRLAIRMFMNVGPDESKPAEAPAARIQRFSDQFWRTQWPWTPRPEAFYDPRAFDSASAVLHAKLAIVDRRVGLVSSANFTTFAQTRNIEVGLRLEDEELCGRMAQELVALAEQRLLLPLPRSG